MESPIATSGATKAPRPPQLPPHPTRPLAFVMLGGGGLVLLGGAVASSAAFSTAGLLFVGFGAFQWRAGSAVQLANGAAAAINRGDMDHALGLVATARARHGRLTYVQRVLDAHASEIAWRRGDLSEARTQLERGRARPAGLFLGRMGRDVHAPHIDALLAVVSALSGEKGAEDAIERVRGAPRAQPAALARAELAHAVLLSQKGELRELGQHLARHHVLLSESLEPRSRALHRALRKMATLRGSSAYRVPARNPSRAPKPGTSAEWLGKVFPNGAELVEIDEEKASPEALAAPNVTHAAPPVPKAKAVLRGRLKLVGLWVALVAALLTIWALLGDAPRPPHPRPEPLPVDRIILGAVVLFVALIAVLIRAQRRRARALGDAARWLAIGDLDRADRLARSVREDRHQGIAAHASMLLAGIAERRADFATSLSECERGLSLLSGIHAMGSSDVLLPQLVAQRSFLFAAMGRDAHADAELTRLTRDFPAYPYAAGAILKTKLVRAIRSGDLAQARELARARGEIAIGGYSELLAEVVLATEGEDHEERVATLREDLAALPAADKWLRAVAPAALDVALPRR